MVWPAAARNPREQRRRRAAEPLVHSRRARAEAAQRPRCSGGASRVGFAYIVGTAMKTVAPSKASHTSAARNGAKPDLPAHSAPSKATTTPCVWWSRACSSRSSCRL
jgi:hypothetical protein